MPQHCNRHAAHASHVFAKANLFLWALLCAHAHTLIKNQLTCATAAINYRGKEGTAAADTKGTGGHAGGSREKPEGPEDTRGDPRDQEAGGKHGGVGAGCRARGTQQLLLEAVCGL
jgi:hypothetical protein